MSAHLEGHVFALTGRDDNIAVLST